MITNIKPAITVLNRIARRNGKVTAREIQLLESLRAQIYANVVLLSSSLREVR